MQLAQLILDQRQELEESSKNKRIIKRETGDYFKKKQESKLIKVITGVRRCGKSTFAYSAVQGKKFAYLNFDDERIVNIEAAEILPSFYETYGSDFEYIFFDEIQNLSNWELLVNRLHRLGFNILITGSNAKLLSKELATHLTGRQITIELFPFSFREYLKAIDFKGGIKTTKDSSLVKHELERYIEVGGFPEIVIGKEDSKTYLRELYWKIIERDVVGRHNIAYKKTFREIAITLLSNPGTSISYNKIKRQFNLGSEHTVKNYISYLEESYLLFLLNRFAHKPIEVEKSEKKVYTIDSGLINNLSLKSTKDYGHIYENIVAIELLRQKSFNQLFEIYYWKNVQGNEVDFVVKRGLKVEQLIQVCYDPNDINTQNREIKALLKASKETKCKTLLIITKDYGREEKIGGKKIVFVPLWKWLLNE